MLTKLIVELSISIPPSTNRKTPRSFIPANKILFASSEIPPTSSFLANRYNNAPVSSAMKIGTDEIAIAVHRPFASINAGDRRYSIDAEAASTRR